jgi:hypothetical protein
MKKEPHENTRQVAERLLKERLHMFDCEVRLQLDQNEVFEDEEESPSYPGVRTVYTKEVVSAQLCADFPVTESWQCEDGRGTTRFFTWATEAQCEEMGIALRGCQDEEGLTHFVRAPVGLSEEELGEHLRTHAVDTERFGRDGALSLKDFSDELRRGTSCLVERPEDTTTASSSSKTRLVRCVDVLLLKLVRKDTGLVLAELDATASGSSSQASRLPGLKRRADENEFLAAKHAIHKKMHWNLNWVSFGAAAGNVIEEETDSAKFPGLPTVYRKTILSAEVAEPQCTIRIPCPPGMCGFHAAYHPDWEVSTTGPPQPRMWSSFMSLLCCGVGSKPASDSSSAATRGHAAWQGKMPPAPPAMFA